MIPSNTCKFFILFVFCIQALNSELPPKVFTFFDLEALSNNESIINGELIQIRGFLYKTDRSEMILAAEPNLKSCCIGSTVKKHKQLLVFGDVGSSLNQKTAVTLKGTFNSDGNSSFPYRIEFASVVEERKQSAILLAMGGIFLILLLLLTLRKIKKERKDFLRN